MQRLLQLLCVLLGQRAGLLDYCREANMRFSVGYELTEQVRAAILQVPEDASVVALDQDGGERENGEVCEITEMVSLSAWPEGSRLIVRRELRIGYLEVTLRGHVLVP